MMRERCATCFACVEQCYSNALETIGREMSAAEVLHEVEKDRPFYEESGGGMTLSGGEPLAQFPFTKALLEGAKALGLHTCVETCGVGPQEHFAALVPVVDLFLFDYKETNPERHRAYTDHSNEEIRANLGFLDACNATTILRCVIIPEVNLRDDHLRGIALVSRSLKHCQAVHVLGYHPLGESKRIRLGLTSPERPFRDITREEVEAVAGRLRELGARNVSAL